MSAIAKTAPLSGNAVVNGLMLGGAWSGSTITYSFLAGDINKNKVNDFDEGDWKAFYREITDNVETFANVSFQELAGKANINFRLDEGGGGESGVPGNGTTNVETAVGIDPDVSGAAAAVRLGTYSVTWFHEIGHALGLKHTHDNEDGAFPKLPGVNGPADKGTTYLNSQINTVMGYTSSFLSEDNPFTPFMDFGTEVNAQPGSYGAIDIAALQHLYGARAHSTGNNTYRFSDDVDVNHGYTTIWDTGGTDTIEYTGTSRAKIDLRAATLKNEIGGGGWVSTSETLTGGFTLANGVTIENAKGNLAADILIGNDTANILMGLRGNDTLRGNAGNDRLDGGAGNDTLDGGAGTDRAIYRNAFSSYAVVVDGTTTVILGEGVDRLRNIEKAVFSDGVYDVARLLFEPTVATPLNVLNGTEGDDTLTAASASAWTLNGRGGNDVLLGSGGNDRLNGGAGNDRLDGRAGSDTMIGGSGDDIFVVDSRDDVVRESAMGGVDTIASSINVTLGEHVENIELTGSKELSGTGNDLHNRILGNGAANILAGGGGGDRLDGRGGRDQLFGGRGDDYYVVDNVGDVLAERAGEGTDHVDSTVSFRLGANMENLYLIGTKSIQGTGNEMANALIGNSAANTLQGLAGNDFLNGAGGNDRLIGGAGVDALAGGAGNDMFVFRNGDTGKSVATADTITDFQKGDHLDFTAFVSGTRINLNFIDGDAFSGALGEFRFTQVNGVTLIEGDMNGDRETDTVVKLNGVHTLTAGDFLF
ncbi:Ca2+-binding RTX toxin-like protein [Rhizobium sp. PP-F2F-G38]|nr:Ca2+-binding RTX toxin-like protein [Rhizobium sp. PP-WC-1G-195]PYE91754.1 Ca2+-binding RTX toxin-like protein [Rhizobium sp. PP-F2F-G38]TCQ03352.1 Ca2+-binding RTX toxin-like protein [Rhizobium sp. PP-F2F-G36]